ncbi:hypothetical protein G8C92_26885 [Paenibacillus donghaensis]|uniref:hypothetical protein n=1 Tax=Paenibacillus donghaensis TaxID=414771 RepID=UPI001883F44C|nr:hypothetical protein [Paenibacillus donghaensis]MBE9917646.1 hypothetical protein [Paenibacillus donghaensis]
MFDPTIFDNLKVAFENQLYDLDNLDGLIRITGRTDRLEMSVMSREFAIRFELAAAPGIFAEIRLEASLADLAAEILELKGESPGCALRIGFGMTGVRAETDCEKIGQILQEIWPGIPLVQTLSRVYGQASDVYDNAAELRFGRKINEEQMQDISELITHALRTLEELTINLHQL